MKSDYEFLEWVINFYNWQLMHCEEALEYLVPRINKDWLLIKEFNLGLAGSYNELAKELEEKYPHYLSIAGDLGLIRSRDGGGYYDVFRERIIIPIYDEHGNPVGLGGRAFVGDYNVKYINSAASEIFTKNEIVFNLSYALPAIKQYGYAILAEGFFDVISLHHHGWENVVAGMGTAFGKTQAEVLRTYTSKVLVAYDGDDAGHDAALKVYDVLKRVGFAVKFIKFPDNHDPESYVNEVGNLRILKDSQWNVYQIRFMDWMEKLAVLAHNTSKLSVAMREFPLLMSGASRTTVGPLTAVLALELEVDEPLFVADLCMIDSNLFGLYCIDLAKYEANHTGATLEEILKSYFYLYGEDDERRRVYESVYKLYVPSTKD